ncbi:hypothetical protein [Accumulibacter sp.]|uniref:hypothetical protein n=1 Tax=Accumulibacter sp. TaxID=2053492 RepID=UPI0025F07BCF|nr:hypothetical protein [Accumulibacter sp.]MCM8596992.1 hypothetical protein [Accumulibacter sp.]MDS4051141.1 hypothetical protein [Accumulibacter sp.]
MAEDLVVYAAVVWAAGYMLWRIAPRAARLALIGRWWRRGIAAAVGGPGDRQRQSACAGCRGCATNSGQASGATIRWSARPGPDDRR